MKFIFAVLILAFGFYSFAEEITSGLSEKGINETVNIHYYGTTWGFQYELKGFYVPEARVNLIPVTKEAAAVLRALDRKTHYTCVLIDSTFVPEYKEQTVISANYFVREITCPEPSF